MARQINRLNRLRPPNGCANTSKRRLSPRTGNAGRTATTATWIWGATGENPARWKEHLDGVMPKTRKVATVEHFPAMPYSDVAGLPRRRVW